MKIKLTFSIWLVVILTASILNGRGTPIFNPENGHYYEAFSGSLSWPTARDNAAAMSYMGLSGHLVAITSASENNFVFGAVYLANFGNFGWVWLGGFQPSGSVEPTGGWSWVTGEPFIYTGWDTGQPSDIAGNPNGYHQDFLLMWEQGYWNDASGPGFGGGAVSGYIVEYEVVPEPGVLSLLAFGSFAFVFRRKRGTCIGGCF
jgi:hypothetical protein